MKKLAIIIGGSRGLGLALCQQFSQQGYGVIECSRSGNSAQHVSLDLSYRETSIDALDQLFNGVNTQDYSELVLVINSGVIQPIGPLSGSEPKQWWTHLDVNLVMPISIMGLFQRHFSEAKLHKKLAFVSSGAANAAIEGWSLYGAAKAGVEHFVRTMAQEQKSLAQPIQCLSLDPGVMDTQMQNSIRTAEQADFAQVEHFKQLHAQGHLADPQRVAKNILQVLSSEFASGETLYVGAE